MKQVTRTIERTKAIVTGYDVVRKDVVQETFFLKDYNSETALKTVRNRFENDTFKIINVEPVEFISKKYGMSEETYVNNAVKSDSLKIGWINRTISEYIVKVLVYEIVTKSTYDKEIIFEKVYDENEKNLKLARKEIEPYSSERVIDIISVNEVKGIYSMKESDFVKIGYEINNEEKADE